MQRISAVRLLAASSALILTATPVLAQDDDDDYNDRDNYTGFYVGVSAGAAVQANDRNDIVEFDTDRNGTFNDIVRTPVNGAFNAFAANTGVGAPAFAGGFCNGRPNINQLAAGCSSDKDDHELAVKVGYDQQMGSLVVGAVLEASKTDAEDYTTAFSTTPAAYAFSRGLDYALALRGRVGYTPDGSGLFYVTGGAAYAKLDHEFASTNTANFGGTPTTFIREVEGVQRGGNKVWGYQYGGGAEYTLGNGLGVGIEYLFNTYDDEDYFVFIPPSTPANVFGAGGTNFRPSDEDFTYHSIRVNLTYKFR